MQPAEKLGAAAVEHGALARAGLLAMHRQSSMRIVRAYWSIHEC